MWSHIMLNLLHRLSLTNLMTVHTSNFVVFFENFFDRIDLCHQSNDEDEEDDDSCQEYLLEKPKTLQGPSYLDHHKKCSLFHCMHVGSRQRCVVVVCQRNFSSCSEF